MIHKNSLEAFRDINSELNKREEEVYNALKELGAANNTMIAKYLNLPINSITGRMHTLRTKKFLVCFSHTSKCPITGRTSDFYKIK